MALSPRMATAADPTAPRAAGTLRPAGPWRLARAPAKVNLGLRVVGRREDGYHLLDSLIVFATVSDHVAIAPAEADAIVIRGPFAAGLAQDDPADNLALTAAHHFRSAFGGGPVRIRLWKRLPVAAGIGGGSSDAAAVLRLLATQTGLDRQDPDLMALALSLGADTPMCLSGATLRASGIGEILEAPPMMPPLPAVLVNPGVAISTPSIFRARHGDFSARATLHGDYPDVSAVAAALKDFGNDLTAPAIAAAPIVGDVLKGLGVASRFAGMSGSGATCFGLYDTDAAARRAAAALRQARPSWWVATTWLNT